MENDDYMGYKLVAAIACTLFCSIAAVVLRYVAKRLQSMSLSTEDYLIWAGLACKIGLDTAGIISLENGMGRHLNAVTDEQQVVLIKTEYSEAYLYPLCITFVKLSVLIQYRRFFAAQSKWFILQINAIIVAMIVWCVAIILLAAFLCQPISKLWISTAPGTCLDMHAFYHSVQIPNIVVDVLIVLLPIREIIRLDLSRRTKIAASLMFLFGIITLIFDVVRLVVLLDLSSQGPDWTYNSIYAAIWTSVDPAAAIVTACIPSMRSLYRSARTPSQILLRGSGPLLPSTHRPSQSEKSQQEKSPALTDDSSSFHVPVTPVGPLANRTTKRLWPGADKFKFPSGGNDVEAQQSQQHGSHYHSRELSNVSSTKAQANELDERLGLPNKNNDEDNNKDDNYNDNSYESRTDDGEVVLSAFDFCDDDDDKATDKDLSLTPKDSCQTLRPATRRSYLGFTPMAFENWPLFSSIGVAR